MIVTIPILRLSNFEILAHSATFSTLKKLFHAISVLSTKLNASSYIALMCSATFFIFLKLAHQTGMSYSGVPQPAPLSKLLDPLTEIGCWGSGVRAGSGYIC